MKKINNQFVASATDKRRAQSHCNAIARRAAYSGSVEAWLDKANGTISYNEIVGEGYSKSDSGSYEYLCCAYTPVH